MHNSKIDQVLKIVRSQSGDWQKLSQKTLELQVQQSQKTSQQQNDHQLEKKPEEIKRRKRKIRRLRRGRRGERKTAADVLLGTPQKFGRVNTTLAASTRFGSVNRPTPSHPTPTFAEALIVEHRSPVPSPKASSPSPPPDDFPPIRSYRIRATLEPYQKAAATGKRGRARIPDPRGSIDGALTQGRI